MMFTGAYTMEIKVYSKSRIRIDLLPVLIYQIVAWILMAIFILKVSVNVSYEKLKQLSQKETFDNPEYGEIMRLLNCNTNYREVLKTYPNINWCLMGNRVYDITEFKHPGG